jgi:hypothetical protein
MEVLEINTEKTKYMFVFKELSARENYAIKIANNPFEISTKFQCLGTAQIKIACLKKLTTVSIQGLPVTVPFQICLNFWYLRIYGSKYTEP